MVLGLLFLKSLAVALATNAIAADGFVSLPFTKTMRGTGYLNLIEKDKIRIKALHAHTSGKELGEPITNEISNYRASVGIGNPPTFYSLIVDTESSNTWVGANLTYTITPTSIKTSNKVSRSYGSGKFSGTEYLDTVTIGPLVITNQSIGVASNITGFSGVDGILGLGPVDLTLGTLSPETWSTIPTVSNNALSQGLTRSDIVAVSFEPTTSVGSVNGEIIFGAPDPTDPTKFIGEITYAPITSTYPESRYWGINQTIRYGHNTIQENTAGIVDTGTTLQFISSDAFSKYVDATGAVKDNMTGLLKITTLQYANLKPLVFKIGQVPFELVPNAQIWPRPLNTLIGGDADSVYLIIGDIGVVNPNNGFQFVIGQAFLERYYSVFDVTNRRVGFARTAFTTAIVN